MVGGRARGSHHSTPSPQDAEWARNLLGAVNTVQACKGHYKTLLPMLVGRNMGALYRVCTDITSNNVPPHKARTVPILPLSDCVHCLTIFGWWSVSRRCMGSRSAA